MGKGPHLSWETQMLQAARAGDRDAWGQLLTKYRPYLMAVAKRVLAHQPPAEWSSVVQSGSAKALERWTQFRGQTPGELLSWLATIVRNQALDRTRNRRAASLPIDAQNALPPDSGSSPSEQVSRRERAARLMSVVDELPSQYQQIIELRFFEKLSHKQIAARMGRSDDAVRSLLVRALRRLREDLGENL